MTMHVFLWTAAIFAYAVVETCAKPMPDTRPSAPLMRLVILSLTIFYILHSYCISQRKCVSLGIVANLTLFQMSYCPKSDHLQDITLSYIVNHKIVIQRNIKKIDHRNFEKPNLNLYHLKFPHLNLHNIRDLIKRNVLNVMRTNKKFICLFAQKYSVKTLLKFTRSTNLKKSETQAMVNSTQASSSMNRFTQSLRLLHVPLCNMLCIVTFLAAIQS